MITGDGPLRSKFSVWWVHGCRQSNHESEHGQRGASGCTGIVDRSNEEGRIDDD